LRIACIKAFVTGRILAIAVAFLLAAPFLLLAIQSEEKATVLVGLFRCGLFSCPGITAPSLPFFTT